MEQRTKKLEKTQTAMELCCPCCKREYEMPRRYKIQAGDFDFSPIPRLLPCLHTLCHSCLQEQFENNGDGMVRCHQCKHQEAVKGVGYLPLDTAVLKEVVSLTSSQIMAVCSRCYDSVPSVSWCGTCSSALCEFHHQDHKLSVDTAKHSVLTFTESAYTKQPIVYRFPPLACPEAVQQDCDLYCHSCGHLVSARAAIEAHKDHNLSAYQTVVSEMNQLVADAAAASQRQAQALKAEIGHLRTVINHLDKEEETNVQAINKIFAMIINKLKSRQKELIADFTSALHAERAGFLGKLTALQEQHDELSHVNTVAKNILDNSTEEGMHMVAAAEYVDFRTETLCSASAGYLANLSSSTIVPKNTEEVCQRYAVPFHRIEYLPEDMNTFLALGHTFGYVSTNSTNPTAQPKMARHADQHTNENDHQTSALFFALRISGEDPMPPAPPDLPLPNTASSQIVIVEARQMVDASKALNKNHNAPVPVPGPLLDKEPSSALSKWQGPLLGKIIIIDETEPALASKYKWKSRFEQHQEDQRPVLTIRKQLQAPRRS